MLRRRDGGAPLRLMLDGVDVPAASWPSVHNRRCWVSTTRVTAPRAARFASLDISTMTTERCSSGGSGFQPPSCRVKRRQGRLHRLLALL